MQNPFNDSSVMKQENGTNPDYEIEMLMDFSYRQRFKEFYDIDPSVWNVVDIFSNSIAASLTWSEFSLDEITRMLDTLVVFIFSRGGVEYQVAAFSAYRELYKHCRTRFSREQMLQFPRNKIFRTLEQKAVVDG